MFSSTPFYFSSIRKYIILFGTLFNGIYISRTDKNGNVTPTSYLELLTMFRVILTQKKKEFQLSIQRLKNGLDKLEDANKSVDEMKILLGKMEPELKKASEETEKMLDLILVIEK